ncbi:DUF1289 domain-containing protein [Marinobacter sp. 1Y8]
MVARKDRVRSPCVSICALDSDDICIGCQRSVDEITRWSQMSDAERCEVLVLVAAREEKVAL